MFHYQEQELDHNDHSCCFQVFKVLFLIALIGASITTVILLVLFFENWDEYAADYWPNQDKLPSVTGVDIEDAKIIEKSLVASFLFFNLIVTLISIHGVHKESFVITLTMALLSTSLLILMVIDHLLFHVHTMSTLGIVYSFFLTICLFSFAFNTSSWASVTPVVPFYDYQNKDMIKKIADMTPDIYIHTVSKQRY